jgi:hypothetical protein
LTGKAKKSTPNLGQNPSNLNENPESQFSDLSKVFVMANILGVWRDTSGLFLLVAAIYSIPVNLFTKRIERLSSGYM